MWLVLCAQRSWQYYACAWKLLLQQFQHSATHSHLCIMTIFLLSSCCWCDDGAWCKVMQKQEPYFYFICFEKSVLRIWRHRKLYPRTPLKTGIVPRREDLVVWTRWLTTSALFFVVLQFILWTWLVIMSIKKHNPCPLRIR